MSKLAGKDFGEIELYDPTGALVKVRPAEDIEITDDLNEEMKAQPALFAFYAASAERAHAKAKQAKYRLHCRREDLDASLRKRDGKKMSEKAIAAEINRDPKMRLLYEKYIEAQRVSGYLYALKAAFDQRASMLQSIGANYRAEGINEVRTLQAKAKRAAGGIKHQRPKHDE